MTALDVIAQVSSEGGHLRVVDGQIQGKGLKNLSPSTQAELKKYRAEIINLLGFPGGAVEEKEKKDHEHPALWARACLKKIPLNFREKSMKNFRSENLAKAQLKQQMLKEQGTPTERLDHAEKARRKPNSMRLAINAKCWDCCCEDRENIRYCASEDCSLYGHRPYKAKS